jgi:hypothetical protein
MNEVVIPLKIQGIAQMKAELRELKGSIASATDPAQMAALAQQAGVLSDKIKDANDAVNVFASGSKFEQVSNGLGGIKDSLMSLDFEEAAEKSKTFATALGGINKTDITKSLKGLTDTVGTMGKAFLKLGAQILINPFFYIPILIVAIIAAIALVLKSFGKLDDVISALMAPVNALIAGFKAMTDWLGLTTFAAEDNAEKTAAANKRVSESSKAREAQVVGDLGREIAELKAAGEDTAKQEEEVSNTKIREANKRKNAAKVELEAVKKLDSRYNVEKLAELKKQIDAENEIIKNANSEKVVAKNSANKKEIDDIKTKSDSDNKEAAARQKAANDKYAAADKESMDQIAAARKIVTDSTKTAQQIELDDLAATYAVKIATATKYKNDTTALIEAQGVQEAAIKKKYTDAAKATEDASHAANIAKIDAYNAELAALTDTEEQKLYDKYAADLIKFADNELALFNIKKKYAEDTTALKKTEADKQKVIDDAVVQGQKDIAAAQFDVANNAINLLKSVSGKSKALQAAVIVADAAMGISKIISSTAAANAADAAAAALMGPAGAAYLTTKLTLNKVNAGLGIASIAVGSGKALAALGKGGSPSGNAPNSSAGGGGESTTAVAPASAPNLFGNANTGSQVTAGGGSNNITVTAIVSETEITASQNHINNIQQNSVL